MPMRRKLRKHLKSINTMDINIKENNVNDVTTEIENYNDEEIITTKLDSDIDITEEITTTKVKTDSDIEEIKVKNDSDTEEFITIKVNTDVEEIKVKNDIIEEIIKVIKTDDEIKLKHDDITEEIKVKNDIIEEIVIEEIKLKHDITEEIKVKNDIIEEIVKTDVEEIKLKHDDITEEIVKTDDVEEKHNDITEEIKVKTYDVEEIKVKHNDITEEIKVKTDDVEEIEVKHDDITEEIVKTYDVEEKHNDITEEIKVKHNDITEEIKVKTYDVEEIEVKHDDIIEEIKVNNTIEAHTTEKLELNLVSETFKQTNSKDINTIDNLTESIVTNFKPDVCDKDLNNDVEIVNIINSKSKLLEKKINDNKIEKKEIEKKQEIDKINKISKIDTNKPICLIKITRKKDFEDPNFFLIETEQYLEDYEAFIQFFSGLENISELNPYINYIKIIKEALTTRVLSTNYFKMSENLIFRYRECVSILSFIKFIDNCEHLHEEIEIIIDTIRYIAFSNRDFLEDNNYTLCNKKDTYGLGDLLTIDGIALIDFKNIIGRYSFSYITKKYKHVDHIIVCFYFVWIILIFNIWLCEHIAYNSHRLITKLKDRLINVNVDTYLKSIAAIIKRKPKKKNDKKSISNLDEASFLNETDEFKSDEEI